MDALSARLGAIASLCPAGRVVADIGADHGLLPLWLLRAGRAPRAIAVDVNPGPVAQLRARAAAEPRLEVRAGDGLRPLRPGEAQIIVMAGIGGHLALRILDAAPAVWGAAERLVVQVNEDGALLRAALRSRGLRLVDQRFTEERGRAFFTDAYAVGAGPDPSDDSPAASLIGGPLLADPPDSLRAWVAREAARLDGLLAGLTAGGAALRARQAALAEAEARWAALRPAGAGADR